MVSPVAASASGEASFESCAGDFERNPDDRTASRCFYKLATGPRTAAEAEAWLDGLAADHPEAGWPWFYLALLRWDEPGSDGLLRNSAEKLLAARDYEGALLAGGNLQYRLFELNRLEEAGEQAQWVAEAGRLSGEPELQAQGQVTLARHLLMVNRDLEEALRLLEPLEELIPTDASPFLRHEYLTTSARLSLAVGRTKAAKDFFERLLGSATTDDNPTYEAIALYGLTQIEAGDLAEAPSDDRRARTVDLAQKTLGAAERASFPEMISKAHWVLGLLGPPGERRDHFQRCAEAAETGRDRSFCLAGLARVLGGEDPVAARSVIGEALRLAEAGQDPWSAAFSWSNHMRVSWRAEPTGRAITDSWNALDAIERLRNLQEGGSDVQAGLFSTWADDYHWFAGRLLEEARETGRADLVTEAFAVSERLRARALTDWLRATGQAHEGLAELGFASLPDVQSALGPGEALLTFQVAPWEDLAGEFGGGSWVIAVTRRSARAHPLPGRRDIRGAVDLYVGRFRRPDGDQARHSAGLFGRLLAPALAELPAGVDRLILVPDDALHRLPFGALRPAPDARPLAATHRLSVAPSATLWLGWPQAATGAVLQASAEDAERVPALVLAAPAAPGDLRSSAAASAADRAPDLALLDLPPLRHARREGQSVVAALGRGTELAMGARASEALLARPDLGSFGVLHLATHAVTDEEHPERSAVVLAPGAAGDPGGPDGLLRAAEIASLDLGGKLVVLSSCRSAAGTVLRGEGVMSLGRAFFQAGARTVVASLWPVRDDEAAVLFEAFYRHLARGETVAAALQAAQAERRAAGAPASAWAAFVVLGDGDLAPVTPAPPPAPRVRLALIAAGAVLTLLLILAVVALRPRLAAALAARRARGRDLPGLAPSSSSAALERLVARSSSGLPKRSRLP